MKYCILLFLFIPLFLFSQEATITGFCKGKSEEPLKGIKISIDGTNLTAETDENGFYTIPNIIPGTYNFTAAGNKYAPISQFNVIIKSIGNAQINFSFQEDTQVLEEIIVKKSKIKRSKENPLSIQSLSSVEIANIPGSNNDVVRAAQSLPGISPSPGGFRNDLIIRGGAPNETVYYLDGMEIPNINHFSTQGSSGGPVGMLNISFIEDVTLSTSSFGAQYDNPLSGVLQFKQRTGNAKQLSGNFRLSATEAGLTFEGPLFKNGKESSSTTFIASVRRSYLQFLFKAIGLPIRPDYWDYQYKLTHKINEYNELYFLGLGSIDDFSFEAPSDFDENQQAVIDQAPIIQQQSNTIGVSWKNRFKNNNGFMLTTLSNNRLKNTLLRFEDNLNKENILFKNDAIEMESKLRYELNYFINDWKITTGTNLQISNYENKTFSINPSVNYFTSLDFFKYGFFGNVNKSLFNNKLDINLGFRMDDDTYLSESSLLTTFSPRASFSYELDKFWRLNSTIGRYFKLPPYTILGFRNMANELINKNVDYTISNHAVMGIERRIGSAAKISLEAFYKYYENYPVSILDDVSLANKGAGFEVLGNEPISSNGKGRAYGIEVFAQQKFINNFFGIFSYTLFYSDFSGSDNNNFKPSLWDSRHLISLTSGYKFKKNWELGVRYRFSGNTPFVPINEAETVANYPQIILDYDGLGKKRLDSFSQLDIRVDKRYNFKKFSLNIFIETQNILAQTIPSAPNYGLNRDSNANIIEPRTLSTLTINSDRIIPTIGIIADF